ncbi:hypothetical protein CDD83_7373 [Cordyceps sp. RAO-2017]|nr:hypothetical protein CDD83_7373 [Cordyceps sp. RAO-2017]
MRVSHLLFAVTGATADVGRKLTVAVRPNHQFEPDGPLALLKAYLKYSVPVRTAATPALQRLQTSTEKERLLGDKGSVTNFPVPDRWDKKYLAEVEVGTPPQKLLLDFDTGSSDLWVFSTETTPEQIHGQTLYDPGSSSTARKLEGQHWSITYLDGSGSSGSVYLDRVTIGGLTVDDQAVEVARSVSPDLSSSEPAVSGILGLGFNNNNH